MISPERRKQDILRSINSNPIIITIKYTEKVEVDGAYEEIETTQELTVRIYNQKSSEAKKTSDTIGTSYTVRRFGMLIDHTVTLDVDSRKSIKFNCIYGNLKIVAIYPQIVKGEICGYQCDLERID